MSLLSYQMTEISHVLASFYSRYRMIILKSPERVLISVSGEIGEQYINNEFTTELLMII